MIVLMVNIAPPIVTTDCLSILTAAISGSAAVMAANKKLAHIWARIAAILDGNVASLIEGELLIWMPAHGSMTTIGRAMKSYDRVVTAIDWRANRLADALAKSAVGKVSACINADKLLSAAELLVKHEAALVGVVTRAANEHVIEVTSAEGSVTKRSMRDSTGCKRARRSCARGSSSAGRAALGENVAAEGGG
jgi:hypothetical protein